MIDRKFGGALCGAVMLIAACALPAQAAEQAKPGADRYVGYYYPKITSNEVYRARADTAESATREARIAFISALSRGQVQQPYAPNYTIYVKGDQADRMIVMALNDHGFRNIYQARGLLAQLTNVARTTDLFKQMAVDDFFTYFDLAKLLGFTSIVISDGASFAHRVVLK